MHRLTPHRATIAGIGTTAALLAAVVAVSLILGGLVAYTASPDGPLSVSEPALSLPSKAPSTAGAGDRDQLALAVPAAPRAPAPNTARRPVTVPARAATADTSRRTQAVQTDPRRPGVTGPAHSLGREPSTGGTGTIAIPGGQTANPGPAPAAPVKSLTGALADTTVAAGESLGGGLQSTVGSLGKVVASVLPALGPTLEKAAQGANAAITGTTNTLAELVRRLGGGAPSP